ncbi:MAG: glycosyltransferase family 2 protein [Solirubrobacteraceae bacterium]
MDSGAPLISVLVPVLNEAATIREVLGSMRAQRVSGEVELLCIDGGSGDRTRAILEQVAREDQRVRVLDNPAREVTPALNIGLSAARGEYVARMDAHTVYPDGYLQRGIERLRKGDVDWVAGPQVARGTGTWSQRVELALGSRLGVGGASFRRVPATEFDADAGFTGVWRRETLEAHGGWDEDWSVNEDGELAARILAAGGRIVCVPELAAEYAPRDSPSALARQYWRYGQYRAKTTGRHPESMRRSHLVPPALLVCLAVGLMPGRLGRTARLGLVAYAAALLGAGAASAGRARSRDDAAYVPLLLATMHFAWAAGFVVGSARFGAPTRALVRSLSPFGPTP